MTSSRTFAIVGAGLAGAKAAEALRDRGLRRTHRPARRRAAPALRAATAVEGLPAGHRRARRRSSCTRPSWYAEQRRRAAARHDGHRARPARPRARHRRAATGCATTSCCSPPAPPRAGCRCPVPTSTGVHYLRTLDDSDRAQGRAPPGRPGGHHRRRLDRAGDRGRGPHRRRRGHRARAAPSCRCCACSGPQWRRCSPTCTATTASTCAAGSPSPAIRPAPTTRRPPAPCCSPTAPSCDADVVIVGVGVTPNVELARSGGLDVDNGILVDEHLRHLRQRHPRRRRRRQRLPPAAGPPHPRRALGQRAAPAGRRRQDDARPGRPATTGCPTSSPTSTTSAWSTPATSIPTATTEVVIRGDTAAREFIAFWLHEGRVLAGDERQRVGRDRPDQGADPVRRAVDAARLADPAVPIGH